MKFDVRCTKEVGALHLIELQLEFGLRIVSDADFLTLVLQTLLQICRFSFDFFFRIPWIFRYFRLIFQKKKTYDFQYHNFVGSFRVGVLFDGYWWMNLKKSRNKFQINKNLFFFETKYEYEYM